MSKNAYDCDLGDRLIAIQIKVKRLNPSEKTRLHRWSMSTIKRAGISNVHLERILAGAGGDRLWWRLRQLLPNEALETLDRHLDQLLAARGRSPGE